MYEFSPTEVKEVLKVYWDVGDRRSVLLLGASGIGKTTLVYELAREIANAEELEFVEVQNGQDVPDRDGVFLFYSLNLSTKQPYDLDGIPRDVNGDVFRYKVLEAFKKMKGRKGILFLDEVTQVARDDMHSALYSLFQFRKAGDMYLGDDVWVIGAGNRREDSKLVRELSDPEINRVKVINVKKPDIDEWKDWMDENFDEWDRTVYAFLKRFPKYAHMPSGKGRTLEQWPSFRNWTDVAVYGPKIAEKSEKAYIAHVVGLVGVSVGAEFLAFRKLKDSIPAFEDVLKNPAILGNLRVEEQYLFAAEMASKVQDEDVLRKAEKVFSWLARNKSELFMLVWEMLGKDMKRKVMLWSMEGKYLDDLLEEVLKKRAKKLEL